MTARQLQLMLRDGAATGRRYLIDVDKLDQAEQRELLRLILDLKDEVEVQRRKVRQPWRVQ